MSRSDQSLLKFAVVIPCYRYGHYLRNCVESVLNQAGKSTSKFS